MKKWVVMVILLLWGWKNWQSLAADHPLFRASIVVNLANKQHWYWERKMVKLILSNTVKPEKKDRICENLYDGIFFDGIWRDLRRHYWMPPLIPMADILNPPVWIFSGIYITHLASRFSFKAYANIRGHSEIHIN